jgi:hypothetical protein
MRLFLLALSLVVFCSLPVQSFATASFTYSALVSADTMPEDDHLGNKVDVNEDSENLAPWSERVSEWRATIAFATRGTDTIDSCNDFLYAFSLPSNSMSHGTHFFVVCTLYSISGRRATLDFI